MPSQFVPLNLPYCLGFVMMQLQLRAIEKIVSFGRRGSGVFQNYSGAREPPQFWKKCSENFGVQPIPRVAPRVAPRIGSSHKLGRECHSENCSENAPEFRELLREWPFHSESVFFKIGVVPRFLNYHCGQNHYSQLSYFSELISITVTVTVIIFPGINYKTVMW